MQGKYRHLRIGVAGLGLEAYWSQFAGLEERLKGYVDEVETQISSEYADGGESRPGRHARKGG